MMPSSHSAKSTASASNPGAVALRNAALPAAPQPCLSCRVHPGSLAGVGVTPNQAYFGAEIPRRDIRR